MRKPTIYEALRGRIGREPSNAELNDEVRRILCLPCHCPINGCNDDTAIAGEEFALLKGFPATKKIPHA